MTTRKILYSPGYGAGWTTWADSTPGLQEFMLTYQPIIDHLEAGGSFPNESRIDYGNDGVPNLTRIACPVLRKFAEECLAKFGDVPYLGGARDLQVAEVSGRVRIHEHDGYERYEEEGDFSGWI